VLSRSPSPSPSPSPSLPLHSAVIGLFSLDPADKGHHLLAGQRLA
jgi:hypothetical protein